MSSASGYNYHRFARAVLKKARKWEPSLSIQLYPTYWRFENSVHIILPHYNRMAYTQELNFLYDGPMKPFLMALRAQVIPAALIPFLYDIRPPVSFVDGCLVVELQDFRKVPEVRTRVVMRPAPETLPLTIDIMLERRNESWDDKMTLELESRIMAATSPPLYLGTSLLASRNAALSLALTAPAGPNTAADGAFRSTHDKGEDEDSETETLRKLLGAGAANSRGAGGAFQPNWSILRLLERIKLHNKQKEEAARAAAARGNQPEGTAAGAAGGPPPPPGPEEKKKSKKKRPAPAAADEEEKKPAKKKKAAPADKKKDKDKDKDDEKEKEKEKPKGKKGDKADKADKDDDDDKKKDKPAKGKDKVKKEAKGDAKADKDKKDDDKKPEPKKKATKAATEKKKKAAPKKDDKEKDKEKEKK